MNETRVFNAWLESVRDEQITVPLKKVYCFCCNGKGVTTFGWHSDDAAVFTDEDFMDDPDLGENLSSGMYDKECPECDGRGTVMTLDEENATPEVVQDWHDWYDGAAESDAVHRAERAMGA